MTTATNPDSPPIDNTWINQDGEQRIVTLKKLDPSDATNAAFFKRIAIEDEHEAVRCCAIAGVTALDTLAQLQSAGGKVGENAQQQSYRVIAGILDSEHSEEQRIEKLQQLPSAGIKQVALITKQKPIGTCSVDALKLNEDLADLCLFAASVHVRKTAAHKIEDPPLLKDILTRVSGKDKTVSKIISARLEATSGGQAKPSPVPATETPAAGTRAAGPSAEKAAATPDKKTKDAAESPQDPAATTAETDSNAESTETTKEEVKAKTPAKAKKADAPAIDPKLEFETVEPEASKLSFKNTSRLFEVRSQLRKLLARLPESELELPKKIEALQSEIEAKIGKNNEFQEKLREKTEALLGSLAEALEAGHSENATQLWDKIQGNISNTANQVRAELQKKANEHKEKLTELRDWKIFAATEKKKELITQMQHLIEAKMHASDRSKSISKMHKEWKDLGRSNQNEQLWKQFKTLSDQAYEPCKEYFKQRKQLMAENLQKRRALCDSLEAELKQLLAAEGEADISRLNKLLSEAEKDWKSHAPIEQSKIKSLQKRFYGTVNELRKMRKSNVSSHAKQKQDLVAQAQALTQHEDNKHAMNEAKRLQQEWKKVGPTSYREDNKYWQDFRAACDAIFGKRDQASNENKEELAKIESRLKQILSELAVISAASDSDFRESRATYQDLAQEFSNSLDPRIKAQRKRLLDQFNSAKRQIDSRFRALPDKRQQQTQQSILAKSSLLQGLEAALLEESDSSKFSALQEAFDSEAWDSNAKSGNAEVDKLMQARLDAALSAKTSSDLIKLCKRSEEQFRELCTLAEIRANSDSPAEDKSLRMKLQLEQLQSGFGQAKPDPKQNLKYALNTEFQSYAIGPLEDSTRKSLGDRLGLVLTKLR